MSGIEEGAIVAAASVFGLPVELVIVTVLAGGFVAITAPLPAGLYDLIILNDIQLLPWLSDTKTFPKKTRVAHIHVDLHEWFSAKIPNRTLQRRLTLDLVVDDRAVHGHQL